MTKQDHEELRDIEILQRADEYRTSLRSVFLRSLRERSHEKRQVRTTNQSRYGYSVTPMDAAELMRDMMMDSVRFARYFQSFSDSSEFKAYEYASAAMYADQYADSLAEIDVDADHEEEKIFQGEEKAERIREFRESL